MPVTLIQAMNASLRRVGMIQGDVGVLATSTVTSTSTGLTATEALTVSAHQHKIDVMLQLWNEGFHELQSLGLYPEIAASATITLASDTMTYSLPSDFESIAGRTVEERVLRGATTGLTVPEYPGGYAAMKADRPVATDYKGDPDYFAISPTTLQIVLGTEPQDGQASDRYNLLYLKRLSLTSTQATNSLPYSDTVIDALVPVVAEGHNRVFKKEFDQTSFRISLTRAVRFVTRTQARSQWGRG